MFSHHTKNVSWKDKTSAQVPSCCSFGMHPLGGLARAQVPTASAIALFSNKAI